jgi:putative transposase
MAEGFVKTVKRGYFRVNPIPDAASALATAGEWVVDYNEVHPYCGLGYRSPCEYHRGNCPARQSKRGSTPR